MQDVAYISQPSVVAKVAWMARWTAGFCAFSPAARSMMANRL